MSELPSQQAPVPAPPPALNPARLWTSLLIPPGTALVLSAVFLALLLRSNSLSTLNALGPICTIASVVIVGCWVFFIHTVKQRFRGRSFILLVLAYPLLQVVVSLAIFFTGCMGAAFLGG